MDTVNQTEVVSSGEEEDEIKRAENRSKRKREKEDKEEKEKDEYKKKDIGVLYKYYDKNPRFTKIPKRIHGYKNDYYLVYHSYPQCIQCGRELMKLVCANDPSILDGFYSGQYHGYIHYSCDTEVNEAIQNKMLHKEDLIKSEIDLARLHESITDCDYKLFEESSYRYCSYCDGLITDIKTGFHYPSASKQEKYLSLINGKKNEDDEEDDDDFINKRKRRTESNSNKGLICLARNSLDQIHYDCFLHINDKAKYNEEAYFNFLATNNERQEESFYILKEDRENEEEEEE